MLDPNFIVLRCPFNLLCTGIFKDASIEVKQKSCRALVWVLLYFPTLCLLFVDLPYTNIHTSHAQFSKYPSSGVNLTPKPVDSPIIALFNKQTSFSEDFNFHQSLTCLQIKFLTVKTGYLLVQILATHHCGRCFNCMGGGRGMSVLEVNLTPKPGPSMNSVILRWTPSLTLTQAVLFRVLLHAAYLHSLVLE